MEPIVPDKQAAVEDAALDEEDAIEDDALIDATKVFTTEDFLAEDEILQDFINKIGEELRTDLDKEESTCKRRRRSGPRRAEAGIFCARCSSFPRVRTACGFGYREARRGGWAPRHVALAA
ncbi:hypothetical protein E2562_004670 [Oryza meyeriana var. granulata]|uniref:Uncharacterized protein n=1 Tax=Oryza meyeriana var. granulata TaxID=110450 RepID=A0A6G1DDI4_9ORYZ|nr:hypothetical protein E2562_004670 [Oryza meyeriana var. granulata]